MNCFALILFWKMTKSVQCCLKNVCLEKLKEEFYIDFFTTFWDSSRDDFVDLHSFRDQWRESSKQMNTESFQTNIKWRSREFLFLHGNTRQYRLLTSVKEKSEPVKINWSTQQPATPEMSTRKYKTGEIYNCFFLLKEVALSQDSFIQMRFSEGEGGRKIPVALWNHFEPMGCTDKKSWLRPGFAS